MRGFLKSWWRPGLWGTVSAILTCYLLWPSPGFPEPLSDFYWSTEPADRETALRRGYYTNYYRGDVIFHYWDEAEKPTLLGLGMPAIRLSDYPPEDAMWLVRDQTRANYLEEIVQPMRESIFIAALESRDPLTYHTVADRRFQNRVVVKYAQSDVVVRLVVGMAGLWLLLWIIEGVLGELGSIRSLLRRR